MSLDTTIPPLALRLLTKYGKTVTYIAVVQGAYDPATGTTPTTETSTTLKALIEDYNKQSDGAAFVNGLVMEGDKKITIAAQSVKSMPLPGDKVSVPNVNVFTVKNAKSTFSGELPAIYELHVRT